MEYNGWEGNVWAMVSIRMDDSGLFAKYYAERANDANYGTWEILIDSKFTTEIKFDIPVILGLTFDPIQKQIVFSCNGEQRTYDILTDAYAPWSNGPLRSLQSRVNATSNQSGYMLVDVDDVYVDDTVPPTITNASANPSIIWPVNKKMVNVAINYNATDNSNEAVVCHISSITSNEPINSSDYSIVDAHHVKLRADRLGNGTGRIYTITITCMDASGNTSNQDVTVTVPHDMRVPRDKPAPRNNPVPHDRGNIKLPPKSR
jgi:hypothetical protein